VSYIFDWLFNYIHTVIALNNILQDFYVPVSARTGTPLPRWSPHPSLWCCSSPRPSTICPPELSHRALLSTQHVRLSFFRLCRPDSLGLAAWWT